MAKIVEEVHGSLVTSGKPRPVARTTVGTQLAKSLDFICSNSQKRRQHEGTAYGTSVPMIV